MQSAKCRMQNAKCNAKCRRQNAKSIMQNALYFALLHLVDQCLGQKWLVHLQSNVIMPTQIRLTNTVVWKCSDCTWWLTASQRNRLGLYSKYMVRNVSWDTERSSNISWHVWLDWSRPVNCTLPCCIWLINAWANGWCFSSSMWSCPCRFCWLMVAVC
jgi:hypothetical protein